MQESSGHALMLEELRVAEEELRAQNEELAQAQLLVAQERERYRSLFDHAPIPYLVTDELGVIRNSNHAAANLFRCPVDRLEGKPLAVFIAPTQRAVFRNHLQILESKQDPATVILRVTPRLGDDRVVTGSVAPVRNRAGKLVELRWILTNGIRPRHDSPAERRHLETAGSDDSHDSGEWPIQSTGQLLAWVSHELRTPVASVGGYADILAMGIKGPLNPEQLSVVAGIQQSQSHLLSLLDDLLTFARAGSGHLPFEIGPVALTPVLERLVSIIQPQAVEREIRLQVNDADAATVRADSDRTLQILLNLVDNSVKFTPVGGSVVIGCVADDSAVTLNVQDSGPGIPRESRESIFQPYVQLGRPGSTRASGAGLGLAISRQLARGMGGDLVCTDSDDGRSCFRLRLPRSTGIAG